MPMGFLGIPGLGLATRTLSTGVPAWVMPSGARAAAQFDPERYYNSSLTCDRTSQRNIVDDDGVIHNFASDTPAISGGVLYAPEPARENRASNYNADPTNLNGITTVGSPTVTVVARASLPTSVKAALEAIDPDGIISAVYRLQGGTSDYVGINGNPANTNAHTYSVFAYVVSGSATTGSFNGLISASLFTDFERTSVSGNPSVADISTRQRIRPSEASTDVYFALNQLEEGSDVSSPIVVAGSAGTRAAETLTASASGNNDWSVFTDFGTETFDDVVGDLEIEAGDLTGSKISAYGAVPDPL